MDYKNHSWGLRCVTNRFQWYRSSCCLTRTKQTGCVSPWHGRASNSGLVERWYRNYHQTSLSMACPNSKLVGGQVRLANAPFVEIGSWPAKRLHVLLGSNLSCRKARDMFRDNNHRSKQLWLRGVTSIARCSHHTSARWSWLRFCVYWHLILQPLQSL